MPTIRIAASSVASRLNPGTPLEVLEPLAGEFEMVLVLAVNPGWGGQKFIASTCERVKRLRETLGDTALICVDGGVTRDNIGEHRPPRRRHHRYRAARCSMARRRWRMPGT